MNSLPYVKHDLFKRGVLDRYEEMIRSIDPNKCCCSNYIKRNGITYKVVYQVEGNSGPLEEVGTDENEDQMVDAAEGRESLGLQIDGCNDSFSSEDEDENQVYDMTEDDTDLDRPSVFATTQDYLDDMSESSEQPQQFYTTQDYLDNMSEASHLIEGDQDQPRLVEDEIDDGVVGKSTIDYVKATVKVSEGRRVFSIGEKEEIEEECCLFPHAHQDLRELREHGTYRGLAIGALLPAPVHEGTRSGRRQQGINVLLNSEDIIKNVQKKIEELMIHLKAQLEAKVFKPTVKKMIEHTRTVLDLKTLVGKLSSRSPPDLANTLYKGYRAASVVIEPNLFIEMVDEADYRIQYREYLRRLKLLVTEEPKVKDLDSLSILTKIFDDTVFSKNIEAIMAILARAMVTIGVESVVESWVSVMESHNSQKRPLGEKMIITETSISINGPNPVNCDGVVDEAMKLYWRECKLKNSSDGHFVRKTNNIKNWIVSKPVDRVNKENLKFPFMK